MSEREYWYRIEEQTYAAAVDEFGTSYGPGRLELRLKCFEVLYYTPKGVWLHVLNWNPRKFVLREATKRFACPTKEEALESFIARKERQATILEARARTARRAKMLVQQTAFDDMNVIEYDYEVPF